MEARIAMKFETYAHKIVGYHQLNFHEDPCKDARARVKNARTYDTLQKFKPGQNIMSLLKWNIQIPPPLSID